MENLWVAPSASIVVGYIGVIVIWVFIGRYAVPIIIHKSPVPPHEQLEIDGKERIHDLVFIFIGRGRGH